MIESQVRAPFRCRSRAGCTGWFWCADEAGCTDWQSDTKARVHCPASSASARRANLGPRPWAAIMVELQGQSIPHVLANSYLHFVAPVIGQIVLPQYLRHSIVPVAPVLNQMSVDGIASAFHESISTVLERRSLVCIPACWSLQCWGPNVCEQLLKYGRCGCLCTLRQAPPRRGLEDAGREGRVPAAGHGRAAAAGAAAGGLHHARQLLQLPGRLHQR